MKIKERFPDEDSLRQHIADTLSQSTEAILRSVGPLREEYFLMVKKKRWGTMIIIASAIALAIAVFAIQATPYAGLRYVWIALLALSVWGLYRGWQTTSDPTHVVARFHAAVNKVVFPQIFSFVGAPATYSSPTKLGQTAAPDGADFPGVWDSIQNLAKKFAVSESDGQLQVLELLERSELITEPHNQNVVGDMVTAKLFRKDLFVGELDIKHITGNGKNRTTKNIFTGYFAAYGIPKTLRGKTFVSTEGDKSGFGHQSFWKTFRQKGVLVTELEWNDFEKLLHVATDNPAEARYVLTPNFMKDLYDWWHKKKENIRISFIGSHMYVLFPDKRIRLRGSVKDITKSEVQKYLESIALPLLHVWHLAEDVTEHVR